MYGVLFETDTNAYCGPEEISGECEDCLLYHEDALVVEVWDETLIAACDECGGRVTYDVRIDF